MDEPRILVSSEAQWHAEIAQPERHHEIAYNVDVDFEHSVELAQLSDSEIIEHVKRQMLSNAQGLIDNDATIQSDRPTGVHKYDYDVQAEATYGDLNTNSPKMIGSHHTLKSTIKIDTDDPMSPAAALATAQEGITRAFADNIAHAVLTRIRGGNIILNSDWKKS